MNIHRVYIDHKLTPKDKPDAVVVVTDKGIYSEKIDYLELGWTGIVVTTCKNDMVIIDFPNEYACVYMRHANNPDKMTMFVFKDSTWSTHNDVMNSTIHLLFTVVTQN